MHKINVVCSSCKEINKIPKKDSYKKANCGSCKNSLLDTKPMDLDEKSFDYVIVNSELPVVVDFWAPWCNPCKTMGPIFNEVATAYPLKALFAKVNTQDEQNLGAKYNVRSIPTLIVYKNGIEVKRVSGVLDPIKLSMLVKEFI